MVYITRVRIEVYSAKEVGGNRVYASDSSPPTYIIDEFSNLQVQFGTDRKKDKISFQLINHRELGSNGQYTYSSPNDFDLKVKDLIKIYAWHEPMQGTLSSNLLLNAYIKSFSYDSEESAGFFSFTCFNRTEVLMNSFMFTAYNTGQTIPNMIVETLGRIKSYNINDQVYAYKDYTGTTSPGTRGAYDVGNNNFYSTLNRYGYVRAYKKDAYKTDGSGELKTEYASTVPSDLLFTNKIYTETYKEMAKHLDTLSDIKYTGDDLAGKYLYWVDNSSNLHFEPKSFISTNQLIEHEWSKVKMSKDVDEVINAVIINCGTDPNQNGILALAFNAASMGKNGAKWKYIAKTGIAEKFREIEAKSGDLYINGSLVTGQDNAGKKIDADGYPNTYPWKVQHSGTELKDPPGWTYVANTTTVANDQEYLTYYQRICKLQGTTHGEFITKYHSEPLWKGTWEADIGTNAYTQNQMVDIDINSLGLTNLNTELIKYPLRVDTITHIFNNTGWITTLSIKEDIDYRNAEPTE